MITWNRGVGEYLRGFLWWSKKWGIFKTAWGFTLEKTSIWLDLLYSIAYYKPSINTDLLPPQDCKTTKKASRRMIVLSVFSSQLNEGYLVPVYHKNLFLFNLSSRESFYQDSKCSHPTLQLHTSVLWVSSLIKMAVNS